MYTRKEIIEMLGKNGRDALNLFKNYSVVTKESTSHPEYMLMLQPISSKVCSPGAHTHFYSEETTSLILEASYRKHNGFAESVFKGFQQAVAYREMLNEEVLKERFPSSFLEECEKLGEALKEHISDCANNKGINKKVG